MQCRDHETLAGKLLIHLALNGGPIMAKVREPPRIIVVRLISTRSRARRPSGAFSPLHLVAISRFTRSSTP